MASSSRGDDNVSSREPATGGVKCRVPFSIDAILNSPHPAKQSGCVLRDRCALAARGSQGVGALSSLERFTKNSLRTQPTEESKEDAEVNIERRLAALQARLHHRKRRKARTCFNNQQLFELERHFLYQKYLSPSARDELSETLGLSGAQVITWFQNRRAKFRRELEELKNDVMHSQVLDKGQIQTVCKKYEI